MSLTDKHTQLVNGWGRVLTFLQSSLIASFIRTIETSGFIARGIGEAAVKVFDTRTFAFDLVVRGRNGLEHEIVHHQAQFLRKSEEREKLIVYVECCELGLENDHVLCIGELPISKLGYNSFTTPCFISLKTPHLCSLFLTLSSTITTFPPQLYFHSITDKVDTRHGTINTASTSK